jgi:hypothetical protein
VTCCRWLIESRGWLFIFCGGVGTRAHASCRRRAVDRLKNARRRHRSASPNATHTTSFCFWLPKHTRQGTHTHKLFARTCFSDQQHTHARRGRFSLLEAITLEKKEVALRPQGAQPQSEAPRAWLLGMRMMIRRPALGALVVVVLLVGLAEGGALFGEKEEGRAEEGRGKKTNRGRVRPRGFLWRPPQRPQHGYYALSSRLLRYGRGFGIGLGGLCRLRKRWIGPSIFFLRSRNSPAPIKTNHNSLAATISTTRTKRHVARVADVGPPRRWRWRRRR